MALACQEQPTETVGTEKKIRSGLWALEQGLDQVAQARVSPSQDYASFLSPGPVLVTSEETIATTTTKPQRSQTLAQGGHGARAQLAQTGSMQPRAGGQNYHRALWRRAL